jgi:Zn finger protein HypA/HybF involved in hydrogenase expression
LLRFGPQVPWLSHSGLIPHLSGVPTWFTSNTALVVLGLLAAVELGAERPPEMKIIIDEALGYVKAGMAALTYLGVLSATDKSAVTQIIKQAGFTEFFPVAAVAAGTFIASRAQRAIVGTIVDSDEDDDLGLQKFLRWVGDLWGMLGPVALVVLPILTIAAFGLAVLIMVLIERKVESRNERLKVACASCGQLIHPSAPACPSCHSPVKEPRAIGLLGAPWETPADVTSLPYQLVAVKRCPACATRFQRKSIKQTCEACGHKLMDEPIFARAYIASIDRRVPMTCLVCFAMGLIPVLGVIPGVIYYRLSIVAPFRRYLPPGHGILLRWGIRLAILILLLFQWMPVAGALAVPLMGLINYAAYRTAYRRLVLGK